MRLKVIPQPALFNFVKFVPTQNFYWTYDTKRYFLKGKLYMICNDLYQQVKHYETIQQIENNC